MPTDVYGQYNQGEEVTMGNAVLVHGAWSEGAVWQEVIAALQQHGHEAHTVQLPLTSLDDDIAETRQRIAELDGSVTLVGHSYGGAVISGAARDNSQVESLVFVAAYAPDEGETIPMLSDRGAAMPGSAAILFGDDGWSTLDSTLFRSAVAGDLPERTAEKLAASQRPTHGRCLTTHAGRGAWHELPSSYLVSAEDHILDPDLQRWFAARMGATVTELHSSHLAPLSHPDDVADAIAAMMPQAVGDTPAPA